MNGAFVTNLLSMTQRQTLFCFKWKKQAYPPKKTKTKNPNNNKKNTEIVTEVMTTHRVCSAKYLVVVLDEKLRWHEHVESVFQALTKYMY